MPATLPTTCLQLVLNFCLGVAAITDHVSIMVVVAIGLKHGLHTTGLNTDGIGTDANVDNKASDTGAMPKGVKLAQGPKTGGPPTHGAWAQ